MNIKYHSVSGVKAFIDYANALDTDNVIHLVIMRDKNDHDPIIKEYDGRYHVMTDVRYMEHGVIDKNCYVVTAQYPAASVWDDHITVVGYQPSNPDIKSTISAMVSSILYERLISEQLSSMSVIITTRRDFTLSEATKIASGIRDALSRRHDVILPITIHIIQVS